LVVQEYSGDAIFLNNFLKHRLIGVVNIDVVSLLPLHEEESVSSHQALKCADLWLIFFNPEHEPLI
jgi:hypothetical protein